MSNPHEGPYCNEDLDIHGPQGPAIAKVSRWLERPQDTAELLAASWEMREVIQMLASCDEPLMDRTDDGDRLRRAWSLAQSLALDLGVEVNRS